MTAGRSGLALVLAALVAAWAPPAAAQEACCFADGLCLDLDPTACAASGGTAGGAGTACVTTTCVPQRGACCIGTPFGTTCAETDPLECDLRGGGFVGVGTSCTGAACDTPRACCRPDGTCWDATPIACSTADNHSRPVGTTCATADCVVTEACCMPDGTVCLDLPAADCSTAGGVPQGPGSSCVTRPCTLEVVACCHVDGTCEDLDVPSCLAIGGRPQAPGSACVTTDCPSVLGACCAPSPFGTVCRITDEIDCDASGGAFLGIGTDCTAVPCSTPQACCLPGGGCSDETPLACQTAGGVPQGSGTRCASNPCGGTPGVPGWTPDGTAARPGAPLLVQRVGATDLALEWSPSCSADATDATVHEGTLGTWYSHDAILCDTAGALVSAVVTPEPGDRYFLVVPVTATDEGSYGLDSTGAERPPSRVPCHPAQVLGCP